MPRTSCRDSLSNGLGPLDSELGVLFLAAFPLILMFFEGSAASAFAAVLQLALLLAALCLIHRGQKRQNEYDAAEAARAPRLPRKISGSALIGVMVTILAGHHFDSLLLPLGFGGLAAGLSVASFGLDPMRDKRAAAPVPAPGAAPRPARQAPDTTAALERIDARLEDMVCDIANLGDPEMTRQIEALRSGVRGLILALCEDGSGVERLRKPVVRFVELLRRENAQVIAAWSAGDRDRARRRYILRITALGDTFEQHARAAGTRAGRDAFELQADLLWHRMPASRAA